MQKKSQLAKICLLLTIITMPAVADDYQQKHLTECGEHYFGKNSPQSLNHDNKNPPYYLCFDGFAVGFSPVAKIALWSAEHLTTERLNQAETLERKDSFHPESKLPDNIQASLADYKKAPYDRGHLAPNADMATSEQQYESFSFANIVPQNPAHNRGVWRGIETRTRYLTAKYGEVYVVTGTAFLGKNVKQLNNNIFVPSHLYKAIYIPSLNQAGVYFSPNNDSGLVEVISLNELGVRIGYDVMPKVDTFVQNHAYALPMDNLEPNETQDEKIETMPETKIVGFLQLLLLILFKWFASLLG